MKIKGRGIGINPTHRFDKYELEQEVFDDTKYEDPDQLRTQYIPTFPKTIINTVPSPDVPFGFSINPYQGCEHGCIYCFARPTHNYWGYSSGLDFEQKILVKKNAPELLEKQLKSKKWKASPIALSGNTDCYQPIEAKLKITRSLLEIFYRYRHPVSIITKNALILRDIDLLAKLSKHNLLSVAISLTSLNSDLQRILEPRTASPKTRLKVINRLSSAGIPVSTMMAPVIPALTDHEILDLAKASAMNGASNFSYAIVRLNYDLDLLFTKWLDDHMPDRKERILNGIRGARRGKLSASISEGRQSGHGEIGSIIRQQAKLAKKMYFPNPVQFHFDTDLHAKYKSNQLSLF